MTIAFTKKEHEQQLDEIDRFREMFSSNLCFAFTINEMADRGEPEDYPGNQIYYIGRLVDQYYKKYGALNAISKKSLQDSNDRSYSQYKILDTFIKGHKPFLVLADHYGYNFPDLIKLFRFVFEESCQSPLLKHFHAEISRGFVNYADTLETVIEVNIENSDFKDYPIEWQFELAEDILEQKRQQEI